ncbi:MAG: lipid A biosynthesis acyltransferase [Hydrogenophilales bacterium 16-64-46]|nr:MAG: lipid A biosynthesis acyltransferase [Hydrogenophilales bacterium 12-64-13]OYZ06532.1 MAG: lipid A biosynthesis acyltransferase [Hydrogenophilales bacterium 16-64-46]OZA39240.1 MAG: lipid A biosynthesis acyltransferase [Hydrogenophilales bacterium 17-64-34]HQS98792.1 lipid A biosynthesis acyltransferase [Thiobacillus sp.]
MKPAKPGLAHPGLWGVWLGVALLWLLHWLPLPLQAAFGNAVGWLLALKPGRRRRIVVRNLELCFPDVPAATRRRWLRQTYQTSMRAVLEHGVLWWASDARLRRLIRIDNPEAAHGDGTRPVIWLAPHFVGLDMGGVRLTMDWEIASMYAPAKDPVSDKFMRGGRTRFRDIVLIARHEGIKATLFALRSGRPFYYLPDQDHGRRNSVFVPFFGVAAATVSALPRIAKLADAQIVPVVTRQLPWGRGYAVRFYPPWDNYPSGDLDADVARMNAFIEDRIREIPAQYLWLHRRFKTRPAGEPSLYD